MFADSMILHATIEAQNQSPRSSQKSKEPLMATTEKQAHPQPQPSVPPADAPARTPYLDPLGRPIYQGSPRFTDQQAGGDLTGDESDARDDNFVAPGAGQTARDVSAHAAALPAASSELLRYVAAATAVDAEGQGKEEQGKAGSRKDDAETSADVVPDGTEDPGSSADDGLVPHKTSGQGAP